MSAIPMPISDERANRIEKKLDGLAEAVNRLIIIDERQTTHSNRLTVVEAQLAELEKAHIRLHGLVNKWIWFGSGSIAVLTAVFSLIQAGLLIVKH